MWWPQYFRDPAALAFVILPLIVLLGFDIVRRRVLQTKDLSILSAIHSVLLVLSIGALQASFDAAAEEAFSLLILLTMAWFNWAIWSAPKSGSAAGKVAEDETACEQPLLPEERTGGVQLLARPQ